VRLVRSLAFNVLFYLNTLVWLIIALPTFLLPYRAIVRVAQTWGRTNVFLLRTVAGIAFEVRGREKIPRGALLVASKHQSALETFALMPLFDDPAYILKRELQWLPVFGWLTIKAHMVPVDRGAGARALTALAERARVELARGRQLIIFPEGTRRSPGAESRYTRGIVHLYASAGVPCVPIALNTGLFWPRRSLKLRPGKAVAEVLDPIPPGLDRDAFFERLKDAIESATARLLEEGNKC